MAAKFLLDEDCFSHAIRSAVEKHNALGVDPIDLTWVGAPGAISCGSVDDEVLRWAAEHGRVVISKDYNSLPQVLGTLLDSDVQSPGIVFIRPGTSVVEIVESLVLIAHASESEEWANQCRYLPME